MPNIIENNSMWNSDYNWKDYGEEWSEPWGSSFYQWQITIFPRIFKHLKNSNNQIIEFGPGMGRWTKFLINYPGDKTLVEPSIKCYNYCKSIFKNITIINNNGTSLSELNNNFYTFIFSFDSLVHIDFEQMELYISQFASKMTDDGVGFIHHSNLENGGRHWRGKMTAKFFEEKCNQYGLSCISQELTNWIHGDKDPIDCFSFFTKKKENKSNDIFFTDLKTEADLAKKIYLKY